MPNVFVKTNVWPNDVVEFLSIAPTLKIALNRLLERFMREHPSGVCDCYGTAEQEYPCLLFPKHIIEYDPESGGEYDINDWDISNPSQLREEIEKLA